MKNDEILIQRLKAIENNVNDNGQGLTHGEIIAFCRAAIAAIKHNNLLSDSDLDSNQIIFDLTLISAYEINHNTRSAIAKKCLERIKLQQIKSTQNDSDWDMIPF